MSQQQESMLLLRICGSKYIGFGSGSLNFDPIWIWIQGYVFYFESKIIFQQTIFFKKFFFTVNVPCFLILIINSCHLFIFHGACSPSGILCRILQYSMYTVVQYSESLVFRFFISYFSLYTQWILDHPIGRGRIRTWDSCGLWCSLAR